MGHLSLLPQSDFLLNCRFEQDQRIKIYGSQNEITREKLYWKITQHKQVWTDNYNFLKWI